MSRLGFITPEITMSLGDGNLNLGYITGGITTMLGGLRGPMPTLVGNQPMPQLVGFGQPPPESNGTGGRIIFGGMLLVMGISLGLALGVAHGVKVASRG